ncbi:MAG: hypothetical protein EON97_00965 [Chitinophagaceae bacterium]|nr:MAG: hypothetical protein EON97_00965 [Chitinophagaceae bacterium]
MLPEALRPAAFFEHLCPAGSCCEAPWDHLCVGSDFDGLINPINGFDDVLQLPKLRGQLLKYLPQADKFLPFNPDQKALRYKDDGSVDAAFLNEVIDQFLFKNGLRFTVRFLHNWQPVPVEVPF